MKKVIIGVLMILMVIGMFSTCSLAAGEEIISNETQSVLVDLKDKSEQQIAEYAEKYGSEAYGFTAYVLNLVRIYSIPFCFLGIAISGIYQYVIGIRKLDVKEKGLALMVFFITVLVICQILPLAFAIFVKFGRG